MKRQNSDRLRVSDAEDTAEVRSFIRFSRPPGPCKCGETDPKEFDFADRKAGRPYGECKKCRKAKRKPAKIKTTVAMGPATVNVPERGINAGVEAAPARSSQGCVQPTGEDVIPERIIEPRGAIKRNSSDAKDSQPKRVIEPPISRPERIIEPEKSPNLPGKAEVDYSMWERSYGRVLTDDERREIRFRMTEFFKLLIAEDVKEGSHGQGGQNQ